MPRETFIRGMVLFILFLRSSTSKREKTFIPFVSGVLRQPFNLKSVDQMLIDHISQVVVACLNKVYY